MSHEWLTAFWAEHVRVPASWPLVLGVVIATIVLGELAYRFVFNALSRFSRRTQTQLVHQEKMSSLGRLVAGIAHELNNPINFVYGNVDFLGRYMEDLLGLVALVDASDIEDGVRGKIERRKQEIEYEFLVEDSRKLIRSIRAGAERTAGIVRDLKAFSAIGYREAGLCLDGLIARASLASEIERSTRRYAKRQRVWVRGQTEARRVADGSLDAALALAEAFFEAVAKRGFIG